MGHWFCGADKERDPELLCQKHCPVSVLVPCCGTDSHCCQVMEASRQFLLIVSRAPQGTVNPWAALAVVHCTVCPFSAWQGLAPNSSWLATTWHLSIASVCPQSGPLVASPLAAQSQPGMSACRGGTGQSGLEVSDGCRSSQRCRGCHRAAAARAGGSLAKPMSLKRHQGRR